MTAFAKKTPILLGRNRLGTEIVLAHRSAGTQIAGSRTIEVGEAYGVIWEFDHASHGQWFGSKEEALADFDRRNVERARFPGAVLDAARTRTYAGMKLAA